MNFAAKGPSPALRKDVSIATLPLSEKPGGLKGSMQHWLGAYLLEFEIPTFVAAVD